MTWTPWLVALAPLAYFAAALAPERLIPSSRSGLAAGAVSLLAAAVGLAQAVAGGPVATPLLGADGLGLAVRIDALSATICALIGFVGLIVVAYSRNYLAGERRQGWFIRTLCLTLGLVQGLALSGNVVQLVICWIAASLCVNRLLLFRAERSSAVLAARKRFIVSRLADACLILAAGILWRASGSGDIGAILAAAAHGLGPAGNAAGTLLALTAILSTAQLPFHGWILEVMETPTPVSALLHAGIVNAGGFLVLRFGDVVAAHPAPMILLTIVGAVTAMFGSLVMLTQTSVKVGLAYSTIAQMGFMLLECGLGAYSAALLHLVAHSLYKAHAFLSAGDAARTTKAGDAAAVPAPLTVTLAVPVLVVLGALAATSLGIGPTQQPGAFVLSAVLLLGLAPAWLPLRRGWSVASAVLAAGASVAVVAAYAAGQGIFASLLPPTSALPREPDAFAVITALTVVAMMTILVCLQLRLPAQGRSPAWARAYAHVSNGFYLNTIANRWVLRFWPASPARPIQHGAA